MIALKRLLSVPTWLRMRLAGSSLANLYTMLNVQVYRLSKGKLWAHLYVPNTKSLMPILLLETRGRRTSRLRTTPLIFCKERNGYVLAAANAGHARHPGWFLNLRANPHVHVSIGDYRFAATAREATPAERDALFASFAAAYPPLIQYSQATSREIPMVLLEPIADSGGSVAKPFGSG